MHSIVFFPKRFGLAVDVDGCPGSTQVFLRFGFSKYIHFSFPILIRCKKPFVHAEIAKLCTPLFAFPSTCRSADVVPIFLLSESFPWYADDHKSFGNEHLTSLPIVVEFAYRLHSTMVAIRHIQIFSVYLDVSLSFKSKSPLLKHLNQRSVLH